MSFRIILVFLVLFTACFLHVDVFAQNELPVTPAAYWKLDDATADTVIDERGNYNGIGQNSPVAGAAGLFNTCFQFQNETSGDDEYISLNRTLGINSGSFTLSAWINPAAVPDEGVLHVFGGGVGFGITGDLTVVLTKPTDLSESRTISPSDDAVPLNTWTHIAVTYDSGSKTYSYFVGGDASGTGTWNYSFDEGISLIGKATTAGGLFFGKLDELRVYYGILSADNIKTLANYPPDSAADSFSVRTNGGIKVPVPGVLQNDTDPENDALSVSLINAPTEGSVTLNADGSFVYISNGGFTGTDSFTYSVSDGKAESESSVILTVDSGVDNLPVAKDDSFSLVVNKPIIIQSPGIIFNDYDIDGDSLAAFLQDSAQHGTVSVDPSGFFYYIPDVDFEGDDSFTYIVQNSYGNSNKATVNFSVSGKDNNHTPYALADFYSLETQTTFSVPLSMGVVANDFDADDDVLSAVEVSGPEFGTLTLNSDGSFTYLPGDFIGTTSFCYKVNDGTVDSSYTEVLLDVTPTGENNAPIGTPDSYTAGNGETLSVSGEDGVLANDFDADGDNLSVSLIDTPHYGTINSIQPDGSFEYKAPDHFSGIDWFTYRISDGTIARDRILVKLEISNQPPTANDDSYSMIQDEFLNIDAPGLLDNDTDPENDPLTTVKISDPQNGTLTLNEDGSFSYTPNPEFIGSDSFSYTVNDGNIDGNSANVLIDVKKRNTPPSVQEEEYHLLVNQPLLISAPGLLANDSDADNDLLTAEVDESPAHGDLTLYEDGAFSYLPDTDFQGTDSFSYTVFDGSDYSVLVTVNLFVEQEGTVIAPQPVGDLYYVSSNSPLSVPWQSGILLNDIKGSFDELTAVVDNSPLNGVLTLLDDGSFSYTPNQDFSGFDSFSYYIEYNENSTPVVPVKIVVLSDESDVIPTPLPDVYETPYNTILNVSSDLGVISNDLIADTENYTVELVDDAYYGFVDLKADGSFEYEPDSDFSGIDWFSYILTNASNNSNTVFVKITVNTPNLNTPPSAQDDTFSVVENSVLEVELPGVLANDSDPDGDGITAVNDSNPVHGVLIFEEDGSFSYTPETDFVGTDSFSYRAFDSEDYSNTATVTIDITSQNQNNPPVAQNDSYSAFLNSPLQVDAPGVLANDSDPEGAQLSVSVVTMPENGTLELNADGSFLYTPDEAFSGTDYFEYSASDENLESNVATVTITVANNHIPVSNPDTYSININKELLVPACGVLSNDIDADGDILTAASEDPPQHGELIFNEDGSFLYIPESDYVGTDSFTYYSEDEYDYSDSVTVSISINSENSNIPVVPVSDYYSISAGNLLTLGVASGVLANDLDLDNNILTAELLNNVEHGALSLNPDGSFSYQPDSGFSGIDAFTYRATDSVAYTDSISVTINVLPLNDNAVPVAVFDKYYSPQGASFFVPTERGILANDFDPDSEDPFAITVEIDPYYGLLTMNDDGSFLYEPEDELFTGIDFFSYYISDGNSNSRMATVMIFITPKDTNNPPQASGDFYTVVANSTLEVNVPGVLSNDSDPDQDALSAVKVTDPLHGTLEFNSDGSFTYSSLAGFVGEDSFTYIANDSELNSNIATVSISVTAPGTNNPPVAQDDSYSLVVGSYIQIPSPGLLSNDYDPDGDEMSVNLVEDVSDGTLTLNEDGSFSYESDAVEPSQDWFVYNVTDAYGAVSKNATVTFTAVGNHAPVTEDDSFYAKAGIPLIVPGPGILSNDSDADNEILTVDTDEEMPPEEGELYSYDDGAFVFIPAEGFTGTTSFTYRAEDDNDESNLSTVRITVVPNDSNSLPVPVADSYNLHSNSMLVVSPDSGLLSNDVDADYDSLSVIKVSDPEHGSLTLNEDGSFVYFPQNSFNGIDSFLYKIRDGADESSSTIVKINVLPSENVLPPSLYCDFYNVPQDKTCFIPPDGVIGNDFNFDPDAMTVELMDDANYGFITLNTDGSFEYEPSDEDFVGLDWFSYYIETETGDSATVFVTLNVIPDGENTPPVAQNDVFYSKQDVDLVVGAPGILLNDFDFNDDELSVNLISIPIRGFVTLNSDGSFTYTPTEGFFGQDKFTYSVTDGEAESKPATVILNVVSNDDNAPPNVVDDHYNINYNKILNISAPGILENDFDPEGDELSVLLLEEPFYGTLTLNPDGSFEYEPDIDFYGDDWFTYAAADSAGAQSIATVIISVRNNNIPVPEPDSYALAWNTPLRVFADQGVLANDHDADNDTLEAYVDEDVSHGYLDLNEDGSFEYVPDEDFYGDSDWFTYYLDDGTDESEPVKVTLKVAHQNITIGSLIKVSVVEVDNDLMDSNFLKSPKIYGVYGNANKGALKKLPKTLNPMPSDVAKGVWKKKYSLFYNTNDIKEYGYSGWFAWNTLKPIEVKIWMKYKTEGKITIEEEIKPVFLTPPRFESFLDSAGNPIDLYDKQVKPGTILTIKGKYFGNVAPKVSLEYETDNEKYKYIKLKVLKEAHYPDEKGNPNRSYMNIETGESLIKVVVPTKKIQPGETYPLIINNKIGVAADYDGNLPEITIE